MPFDVYFAHFPEGFPAHCELPRTVLVEGDEDGEEDEVLLVAPRVALMRMEGASVVEIGSVIGTTANVGGRIPAHQYGTVAEQEGKWQILQVNC